VLERDICKGELIYDVLCYITYVCVGNLESTTFEFSGLELSTTYWFQEFQVLAGSCFLV